MVAGWDDLLPAWFTRLHQRYHTPFNSILLVGATALAFGLLGILGVGMQEAFQLLDNAAGIFCASTYVVLFAIPLFAAGRIGLRAPPWLRIASASGAVVSLLYIGLTVVLIVEVENRLMFAVKLDRGRAGPQPARRAAAPRGATTAEAEVGRERSLRAQRRRNVKLPSGGTLPPTLNGPAGQRRDRDMGARRCIGRGEGDPVVRPGVPPVERNRRTVRPAAVVEQRQIRNAHEPIGARRDHGHQRDERVRARDREFEHDLPGDGRIPSPDSSYCTMPAAIPAAISPRAATSLPAPPSPGFPEKPAPRCARIQPGVMRRPDQAGEVGAGRRKVDLDGSSRSTSR